MNTLTTTIPFSGFYESWHGDTLTDAIEQEFEYSGIEYTLIPNAHEEYAKLYVAAFSEFAGIELQFVELVSPRFYNFETDRIICNVSVDDAKKVFRLVADKMPEMVRDRFTSYDGFISFYSSDINDWYAKPFAEWDHNEVGTIFECLAEIEELDEFDIMEPYRCNGFIDGLLIAEEAAA